MIEHCFNFVRIIGSLPLRNSLQALEKSFLPPLTVGIINTICLSPSLTWDPSTTTFIIQVSAVQARSVSANMKTMRNGQLTFLSNSVTVRSYNFSQRIDSQAEYVKFIFPRETFMHFFPFSIGTIFDYDSIPYESDRRSPCTLFPRGRDQSGTASFPYFRD